MPRSYHAVELWEVRNQLVKMGYRFNGNRAYAIQLTKAHPTKKFALTGAPHMVPLQGIKKNVLDRVLHYSENATHAAQQIEALSLGKILEPDVGPAPTQVQQFDESVIERIVQQRTENVLAQRKDEQQQQIAELQVQLQAMQAKLLAKQTAAAPKKRGRPKKRSVVQEAQQALDGPELTDEQASMVANLKSSIDE